MNDNKCEMILVHHSDCECSLCRSGKDEQCNRQARGTHEGHVRVCVPCGHSLEDEGFVIHWDNDREAES